MGSKFRAKTVTSEFAHLKLGHEKIGSIWAREGSWRAKATIKGVEVSTEGHSSRTVAFHEIVRSCNRVSLCGEDDAEKADAALTAKNERVYARIEELNAEAGERVFYVRHKGVSL